MGTCSDKLYELWVFPRKCARFVGADIFDPNYQYSWMTYFVIMMIIIFFACSSYTVYVAVGIDGDWIALLKALCMVGTAVQGIAKLVSGLTMQKEYRRIGQEIANNYRFYEQKRIEYQNALSNCTSLVKKVIKGFAAMYTIASIVVLSVPTFYFILYGEKIFVMQFLIPGIDPSTHSGYYITVTVHFVCVALGCFGNYAGDNTFFIFLLHVPLWKNILKLKFEDLNETALSTNDSKTTLPILLDILRWHQYYSSYTKSLSKLYFVVIFIQIFTSAINIGLTLFVTFLGEWPAGYSYLFFSFVLLYAYCAIGTIIEISNDDVCDDVYNTCLWYELSVKERKMLLMMLRMAQHPTLLTVADILPLSVTTGLSVTKTIYSFFMMLFNCAKD